MRKALDKAFEFSGLCAVRYPRGGEQDYDRSIYTDCGTMSYADLGKGKDVAIISYGRITVNAIKAAEELAGTYGLGVRVVRVLRLKPLDFAVFSELTDGFSTLYFLEEGIKNGGFAEHAVSYMTERGVTANRKIIIRAVDDRFVSHGDMKRLDVECGFTPEQIVKEICKKTGV